MKYTTKGIPWKLIKTVSCSSGSEAVGLELKIKKRILKSPLMMIRIMRAKNQSKR
jgi:predicted GIY-YIG superfamily endonuclease